MYKKRIYKAHLREEATQSHQRGTTVKGGGDPVAQAFTKGRGVRGGRGGGRGGHGAVRGGRDGRGACSGERAVHDPFRC